MRSLDSPGCHLQLVKTAELDPLPRNHPLKRHLMELKVRAFTNLCTDGTGFPSLFPGICSHLHAELWFWAPVFRDYITIGGESSNLGSPGR